MYCIANHPKLQRRYFKNGFFLCGVSVSFFSSGLIFLAKKLLWLSFDDTFAWNFAHDFFVPFKITTL